MNTPSGMYQPLPNILCYDDFNQGLNGWLPLTPNWKQDELDYFPSQRRHIDWGTPMLSTATFPYAGTHGAMQGTYSMKIPTRAVAAPAQDFPPAGSLGIGIKRLTILQRGLLKIEMWHAFKPEQDRPGIGESDVRAIGFTWDIQDAEKRYFCGVRYMNAANGKMQQRWQYLKASDGTDEEWGEMGESAVGAEPGNAAHAKVYIQRGLGSEHLGRRDSEGGGEGFADVPGGHQALCYNETPDKINWHYFAFTVDLAKREYVELRSVNQVYDLRGIQPTLTEPYPRISFLLNPLLWIETDTDRRAFWFIDSIMISMSQE